MAPILVSVLADREGRLLRHQPPATYQAFLELAGRRMARVLVEAYAQDGLLSYTELQWVFLASAETVSRALDLKGAQTRSCSSPVLVEETAEQVASMHSASVILAEDGQLGGYPEHLLQVRSAHDQQPVQALGTGRADPALGIGVRVGRLHRGHQHRGALGAEHVVERARELRVTVTK